MWFIVINLVLVIYFLFIFILLFYNYQGKSPLLLKFEKKYHEQVFSDDISLFKCSIFSFMAAMEHSTEWLCSLFGQVIMYISCNIVGLSSFTSHFLIPWYQLTFVYYIILYNLNIFYFEGSLNNVLLINLSRWPMKVFLEMLLCFVLLGWNATLFCLIRVKCYLFCLTRGLHTVSLGSWCQILLGTLLLTI